MSLPSWCSRSITVSRAPCIMERGSTVEDWEHAQSHLVHGCSIQPSQGSLSPDGAREPRKRALCVWMPPGSDILPGDRINEGGRTYRIVDLQDWRGPGGGLDHIRLELNAWEG